MYVKVATKLLLNLHSLNTERPMEIRRVYLIGEDNNAQEVTAVSGLMLKHYHFEYAKKLLSKWNYQKFCKYCRRGESYRVPGDDKELIKEIKKGASEAEIGTAIEGKAIERCAFEDMHGFLFPYKVAVRRESPIRFSWLLPVLGTETPTVFVTHSRVARVAKREEAERKARKELEKVKIAPVQMIFHREYSSGIYGFLASLDLGSIGRCYMNLDRVIPEDEWKIRVRAAVLSLVPMMGGELGASLTRSMPHGKPMELLVAHSEFPIPAPVSPIYNMHAKTTLDTYRKLGGMAKVPIKTYGVNIDHKEVEEEYFSFKKSDTFVEPFFELLKELGIIAE